LDFSKIKQLSGGVGAICTGRTAGAFLKKSVNNSIFIKKETSPSVN
jgi:hypothetical protein